jgi:hypothetical protein
MSKRIDWPLAAFWIGYLALYGGFVTWWIAA